MINYYIEWHVTDILVKQILEKAVDNPFRVSKIPSSVVLIVIGLQDRWSNLNSS